jgi:hypothetical protein
MTERVLPPVSVGAHRADRQSDAVARRAAPGSLGEKAGAASSPAARTAARRSEAILTTPARAGLLLGASAAVYAVSLAGVSALQADADAQTIMARAPYVEEVTRLQAANDSLERALLKADAEARALNADYDAVGLTVADFQARLDALAGLVAEVEGSAAALPARIKLPTVSMRGAIAGSSRSASGRSAPSTSATTRASGG